jgi:hypothetical protein
MCTLSTERCLLQLYTAVTAVAWMFAECLGLWWVTRRPMGRPARQSERQEPLQEHFYVVGQCV